MTLIIAMLTAGAFAGVLAGLLGVGGGIVIVPVLELVLAYLGVDLAVRMHVAVATSMATIIPTSLSSAWSHHRKAAVDFAVVRYWSGFILAGAITGAFIASSISGAALSVVFAIVALLAAIRMMLPQPKQPLRDSIPRGIGGGSIPLGIGLVSTMMGIGGGTMSVPTLTLCGRPVHIAVGTSSLIGLVIAVPATAAYVVTGWGNPLLPNGSVGYVNLIGLAAIIPATVLCAPLGAALAHRLSQRQLSLFFGAFLLLVAARMAVRSFY